jgi:hypothetical protein
MLKVQHIVTMLFSTFAAQVSALDLKTARTPIHYECRHVLAGGIWADEKTGAFRSGAVQPTSNDRFNLVIERYDLAKAQRQKRCEEEQKRVGGNKYRWNEFCATKIIEGRTQNYEDTHYCLVGSYSDLKGTNHTLHCHLARIFLDTDRLYGVSTDSLNGIALNMPYPITINKFDCQRLDR